MENPAEKVLIKTSIIGKLNKKGFTLIELMLVIMVVGVILFLAVPATRDVLTTDKLKKASRQLIGRKENYGSKLSAINSTIFLILICPPVFSGLLPPT